MRVADFFELELDHVVFECLLQLQKHELIVVKRCQKNRRTFKFNDLASRECLGKDIPIRFSGTGIPSLSNKQSPLHSVSFDCKI
jgi:hypothetical protein